MKMTDPTKDPSLLFQLWETLPEPLKATILGVLLSIVMAFKEDGRTFREKITDVCAMAIIVPLGSIAVSLLGLSGGWAYVLAGALGGYGIGPVKALLHRWAERKTEA
jgi:hypothetical protein